MAPTRISTPCGKGNAPSSKLLHDKPYSSRYILQARITNASEYTLLSGSASVYVDGSFISRSDVPAVSPQESFDCPLGYALILSLSSQSNPSIRVTYHPIIKKLSHSGSHNKSANYVFSQRITVFNTKSISIDLLKIVDQIPASQNSQIEVKLVSPAPPRNSSLQT
ncbi:hypothetical protein R3P38DRAFT_2527620 [Favolaschia claudopus]|uniref:DUF4139 domain-containing protein n=1 Tax=Favolaschia claudopus TaxID=2862362 RepID=A0AAW0BMR4_9AGAR